MKLNDLKPNQGSRKERTRVGRGISAGQGKTAGRGTKGEHARTGFGGHLYRQGGNLPYYRRLPFRRGEGFTPPNRREYNEINLETLNKIYKAGEEVNPENLAAKNLLHKKQNPVVILGVGTIDKPLTVKVQRVSQTARKKIEAVGGKVEIVN